MEECAQGSDTHSSDSLTALSQSHCSNVNKEHGQNHYNPIVEYVAHLHLGQMM